MHYTPKSEKEVSETGLWPAGKYGFEIAKATDSVSKVKPDGTGGNEMIELTVKLFNDDGQSKSVFDYLMPLESVAYKLRHASAACGLLEKYETGLLMAEDFVGKTGFLKLKIQKDKTGQYPDKNVIADYVAEEAAISDVIPPATVHTPAPVPNDDIPW